MKLNITKHTRTGEIQNSAIVGLARAIARQMAQQDFEREDAA